MGAFVELGAKVLQRGYLIIPIKHGEKRPAISAWQNARLGPADIPRYSSAGLGVLCGVGAFPICAIDIDSSATKFVQVITELAFSCYGATLLRVGNAPKALLVYRADSAGWSKRATPQWCDVWGNLSRVEILGHGQQFVAYGTHPITQKPYRWIDSVGLTEMEADTLPVISAEAIDAFLTNVSKEAAAMHLEVLSPPPVSAGHAQTSVDPLLAYEPPLGLSSDEIDRCLNAHDASDYHAWLRGGMALHHEFGGSDAGLARWDAWSTSASDKYKGFDDLAKRWAGFTDGVEKGRVPVTFRSLLKVANAARGVEGGGDRGNVEGADPRRPGHKVYARTEMGNADRLVDTYGAGLMFVPQLDQWYVWTGTYWQPTPLKDVEAWARKAIVTIRHDAEQLEGDERMAMLKWYASSQRYSMMSNMLRIAASDPTISVPVGELDKDSFLLGVANGAVDLRSGVLLPPDPKRRTTRVTSVDYDPSADCPLFKQTLLEVFNGNAELVRFFVVLLGYCILGRPNEDVIIIVWGMGANGKSTILNVVRRTLGRHAVTADASLFVKSGFGAANSGGARPDILALAGARFVSVSEPEEGGELRESTIKSMTGGEAMPARALYSGSIIEVHPTWVAWMATNHKPIVKGSDYGIWRRLVLVPFTRNFETDPTIQRDINREERLAEEMPGILALIVEGARTYLREGLRVPAIIESARAEYKSDMDLLGDWLIERIDQGVGERVTLDMLWLDWEQWAKLRGELRFIPHRKSLRRKLVDRNFQQVHTMKGTSFVDLRLKSAENSINLEDLT